MSRVLVVGNLTIDDVVLPSGETRMATLGGNSVHAATAVVTAGAAAAVVARRGDDFPSAALADLARHGVDLSGLVEIIGPTVRNWVVYEEDGRRHWLYRTPAERSEQVAPEPGDLGPALLAGAAVVHVAAMPLGHAERIVAHVREQAPDVRITLDTHESWDAAVAGRVLALAGSVDVFVPSREELTGLVGAGDPVQALTALAHAGVGVAVLKAAAAGAYVLDGGRITHVPALAVTAVDATGAGDAFCGGLAAGLARGLSLLESAGLGAAVAGTAITASGSLRLFEIGTDHQGIAAAGHELAAAATVVCGQPARPAGSAVSVGGGAGSVGGGAVSVGGGAGSVGGGAGLDARYDIDVMRREILTIPDVVSDVLDDADGHVATLAKRLAARGARHLWLTGCGDSAFAGLAAELAFQRHSGLTAHPVHALDLARYRARVLPAGSAVIAVSFSGKVGRTIEAAIQARRAGHHVVALTNASDGPLALASDEMLPVDVPTLGFSPGTSTYVAMLCTLLRLAGALAELRGDAGELIRKLASLPGQVAATLRESADVCGAAAGALRPATWVAFLGAGPNEATARFGAAKLFEGAQRLGVATSVEEWAHEQYFVTSAGDPVVLVNPSGAGYDRGVEILSELRFMAARPVVISDRPADGAAPAGELAVPLAAGVPEELSPVTACLPPALIGFHLAALTGKQSYNFSGAAARAEHYETIHRVTVGEPGMMAAGAPDTLADVVGEAERVVAGLQSRGVVVRLLGGVGVAVHRHGQVPAALARSFADIDLVVGRKAGHALAAGLAELGYTPNDRFNAVHGARRLLFYDHRNARQMDVFVGEFAMCHRLDLSDRLDRHALALAPADLLLTKLQIVEINSKDVVDAVRLIVGHEVRPPDLPEAPGQPDVLSLDRLAEVTRADWGWHTTFGDNLRKVGDAVPDLLDEAAAATVLARIDSVAAALDAAPKTARWKARALVGRHAPWYELPEEVDGARR